jgi:glycerophosphoryl diester phosphodiesterase
VPVGVGVVVVGPVAVLIDPVVPDLGGQRVDGGILVVAVPGIGALPIDEGAGRGQGALGIPEAVAIGVDVDGAGPAVVGVLGVGEAVAVVVQPVGAELRGAGVDGRVGVVAVPAGLDATGEGQAGAEEVGVGAVAVAVAVQVPGGGVDEAGILVVGEAVAVLVGLVGVADLGGPGVDPGVAVVAVLAVAGGALDGRAGALPDLGVAVAIPVGVTVPGGRVDRVGLVQQAVAVVVLPVAALLGVGVDGRIGVVAVAGLLDRTDGPLAAAQGGGLVAPAVAVGVGVEEPRVDGVFLVDLAVAVVVDAVAALDGVGRAQGIAVVAVVGRDPAVVVAIQRGVGTRDPTGDQQAEQQRGERDADDGPRGAPGSAIWKPRLGPGPRGALQLDTSPGDPVAGHPGAPMSRRPFAALLPLLALTGGCGFIGSGDDPLVIAFRGGNGYWPENSRLAIANAVLQPWDGIHIDLAVTADGVAVLHRDAYLSSELCTGVDPNDPTGEYAIGELEVRIQDYSFEHLQDNYRCGGIADPDHPDAQLLSDGLMPFDEALDYFVANPGYFIQINVVRDEVNTPDPQTLATAILDPWFDAGPTNRWRISAPDEETIEVFDAQAAALGRPGELETSLSWPGTWPDGVPAGAVVGTELALSLGLSDPVGAARSANADGVAIPYPMVDRELARKVRAADLSLQVLEVKRPSVLHTFERWPVDSIVSSSPEPTP